MTSFSSPVMTATRARLAARFGAAIEPWWERLPSVTEELASRWELELGDPVGRGNTSLVMRCSRADGHPTLLKLAPEAQLARAEAWALRSWGPSGRVPAVWEADDALGAVLLEAIPGERTLLDSGRVLGPGEAAGLIGALHDVGEPALRGGVVTLAERVEFMFGHWIERHGRNEGVVEVVPVSRLERGHSLARELAAGDAGRVLLHGDLHPGNVLDGGAERGLVVIDPRACVGDPPSTSSTGCSGGRTTPASGRRAPIGSGATGSGTGAAPSRRFWRRARSRTGSQPPGEPRRCWRCNASRTLVGEARPSDNECDERT